MNTCELFNYVYPLQHPLKNSIIHLTCSKFNIHEYPEVLVVNHDHMQRAARQSGTVYGWFSYKYPKEVFISDRIKLHNNRQKEVLAHEIVHYCQYMIQSKYGIDQLEAEADIIAIEVVQSLHGG